MKWVDKWDGGHLLHIQELTTKNVRARLANPFTTTDVLHFIFFYY